MTEFKTFIQSLYRECNVSLIEAILSGYNTIYENIVYPVGFNIREFEELPNFAARTRYAGKYLTKIGKGSSRTVYQIDDDHVLKIAHNNKGIAQNRIESDGYIQQVYPDIIARVIDSNPDDLWIVAEKAKKITKSRFKQITGFPFEEFASVLRSRVWEIEGKRGYFRDMADKEDILEDEFFNELVEMIVSMDLEVGDMTKLNSYGEIDDDPVITDIGLSKDVWKEHYK